MTGGPRVTVTVYGLPATKGSMKCVGARGPRSHVLVESNKGSAPWRAKVADALSKVSDACRIPEGSVDVDVELRLPRPAAHYGTGRNAGQVKPRHVDDVPTGRGTGDVDKYARLILDAMQDAGVITDDAQVTALRVSKRYVEQDDPQPQARVSYRRPAEERTGVIA